MKIQLLLFLSIFLCFNSQNNGNTNTNHIHGFIIQSSSINSINSINRRCSSKKLLLLNIGKKNKESLNRRPFLLRSSSTKDIMKEDSTGGSTGVSTTTSTIDQQQPSSSTISSSFFTTKPMSLYIEDTDAYGVMFNANYVKFYERALQEQLSSSLSSSLTSSSSLSQTKEITTEKARTSMITHVTNHKFKSSPTLGSQFVIQGEKIIKDNHNGNNEDEQWSLKMIKYNNDNDNDDSDNDDDNNNKKVIVYNTATIIIRNQEYVKQPLSKTRLSSSSSSSSSQIMKNENMNMLLHEDSFRTYRDEFVPIHEMSSHDYMDMDMDMETDMSSDTDSYLHYKYSHYYLPFHSILKYFERARSNALGGPAMLHKMKEEGIIWVVTSIDDLNLCNDFGVDFDIDIDIDIDTDTDIGAASNADNDKEGMKNGNGNGNENVSTCRSHQQIIMNKDVNVKMASILKRGGMILECKQELLVSVPVLVPAANNDNGEEKQLSLVASGTITLCAVDVNNGFKPTRNIPDWVKELWEDIVV